MGKAGVDGPNRERPASTGAIWNGAPRYEQEGKVSVDSPKGGKQVVVGKMTSGRRWKRPCGHVGRNRQNGEW